MTTLEDSIIQRYIDHPKTGPEAQKPEFKELSAQFHTIFKLCVARAKLRGELSKNTKGDHK